jgi:hypothetical protein
MGGGNICACVARATSSQVLARSECDIQGNCDRDVNSADKQGISADKAQSLADKPNSSADKAEISADKRESSPDRTKIQRINQMSSSEKDRYSANFI